MSYCAIIRIILTIEYLKPCVVALYYPETYRILTRIQGDSQCTRQSGVMTSFIIIPVNVVMKKHKLSEEGPRVSLETESPQIGNGAVCGRITY